MKSAMIPEDLVLIIQDVAEPQIMSRMSSRMAAHPFQKNSKAVTNLDLGVSIQGISSMKTTFFFADDWRISSFNISKASSQCLGVKAQHILRSLKKNANQVHFLLQRPISKTGMRKSKLILKRLFDEISLSHTSSSIQRNES